MITAENLKIVFDSMTQQDVNELNQPGDYIIVLLNQYNAGFNIIVMSCNYDDEKEESVISNGNLFLDKDDFLRLFKESGSVNPYLIELM